MSLTTEINDAIKEAFDNDLSDAAQIHDIRLITKDDDQFDVDTGEFDTDPEEGECRGVVSKASQVDIDELGAEPGSYKFLVLTSDQIGLSRQLEIGDEVLYNGKYASIYKINADPLDVTRTHFLKYA